jgi:hypothetical protein
MAIDLMHGSHFAKSYVNSYLAVDLPVRLVSYRNGWNLDDVTLPNPVKYTTYEPIALDEWPTIITVAISMSGLERIGFDRNNPLYRVNYNMRTYVWVRSDRTDGNYGPEEATLMRDRLTTVVRSAILDYPCLKATDPRQTFKVMIDESSVTEEYSDLTLLKGDRVMAGAYIGYDLSIDEIVMREPIGTVTNIDLTVESFGLSESRSAVVTGASKSGTNVTYTAVNNFTVGQKVTVTGINPETFAISAKTITAVTPTSFTVGGIEGSLGAYVSNGVAVAFTALN